MKAAENNSKIKRELTAKLDSQLSKAATDLMAMLSGINLLNKDAVISKIRVYEKTLTTIQKDFVSQLSSFLEDLPSAEKIKLNFKKGVPIGEAIVGLMGAGGAIGAGTLITVVQTSGWWVFSTTAHVSLASVIAVALGVSTAVATAGLAIAGGSVAAVIMNKSLKSARRRRINRKVDGLISESEQKIKLWADKILESLNSEGEK